MPVPERAVEDLRTAGFPLLELADTSTQDDTLIPIDHPPFGREGLLPASLFRPMAFDLSDTSSAAISAHKVWTDNAHVTAVIRGHLGPHGARLGSSIFHELVLNSGQNRGASCAVTTVRIALDGESGSRVFASVWDDGEQYGSTEDMQEALSEDEWGNLDSDPALRKELPDDSPPFVTHAIRTATMGFGGAVRLLSGDKAVQVRYDEKADAFAFKGYTVDPTISGNLLIAEIPSVSTRTPSDAVV